MDPYATSHFSNRALLADLRNQKARESGSTAVVLSRIAEVDERKLYLEEGYPSMIAFCIQELNYSEGAAYKRVYAARAARRFPVLFVALADGYLHLSGVVMLSKHLTSGNVDELVAAAQNKSKTEIEHLIAQRFPRPDLPERLYPITPAAPVVPLAPALEVQLSPGKVRAAAEQVWSPVDQLSPGTVGLTTLNAPPPALGPVSQLSPGKVEPPARHDRMMPLAPQRYGVEVTFDQEAHDLLEYAQALMGHPSAAIAPVLTSALKLWVAHLEKQKFAVTTRPGHSRCGGNSRYIPAAVRRAVCERDQGQCSFVAESGKRCGARRRLEFDHEVPVARGGLATVENVRLRCRAHNQYAAERMFGTEFMEQKRREARHARR